MVSHPASSRFGNRWALAALMPLFLLAACGGEEGNYDYMGQIAARYRDTGYFDVLDQGYRSGSYVDSNTYKVSARITVRIRFDCSELKTIAAFAKGRLADTGSVSDAISAYAANLQISNLFGTSCKKGDQFNIYSYALFEKRSKGWLMDFEVPTSASPL